MSVFRSLLPSISKKAADRFETGASDPQTTQINLLRKILRRNRDTAFGREYGFRDIRTLKEFSGRVPIQDFEGFRPYVERLFGGEEKVLTDADPIVYATTSGTTGQPKYIPITHDFRMALKSMNLVWLRRSLQDHPTLLNHTILCSVSPAIEGYINGHAYGSMSGITYRNVPRLLRKQYTLPYEIFEVEDYDLRYAMMVRIALEKQVSLCFSPNPSTWLRLAMAGDRYGEQLVRSIHDGVLGHGSIDDISTPSEKDDRILADLARQLKPNPERARELDAIMNRSEGRLLPRDYWPHLALIGCWLGGSAGIQAKLLADYYGIEHLRDLGFRASEAATMTLPFANGTAAGVLTTGVNYYEFIPESEIESKSPTLLQSHELELGQNYYIILTTESGLYRYDINDVITVESFYRRAPIISFVRKGRDMVSLTGEKLHANQIIGAIQEAEREVGIRAAQFRLIPDVNKMRYDLLIEAAPTTATEAEAKDFAKHFDKSLAKLNGEYAQKRTSSRLDFPRLALMKPGWAEREKRRAINAGKRESQFKWPVIKLEWDEPNLLDVHRYIERTLVGSE